MRRELLDNALAAAFVGLCAEKPPKSIIVLEICETCGVSKQTFYNHFRDKQNLMNYLFERTLPQLWRISPPRGRICPTSRGSSRTYWESSGK